MNWFKNFNISKKIMTGYILITLITVITGVIGIRSVNVMEKSDQELYNVNTKPIAEIGTAAVDFQKIRLNVRDAINATDPAVVQQKLDRLEVLDVSVDENLNKFQSTIVSSSIREEYDLLVTELTSYAGVVDQVKGQIQSGQIEQAQALINNPQTTSIVESIDVSVDKLYKMKIDDASNKQKDNINVASKTNAFIIALIVIASLISMLIGIIISRGISRPLIRFSKELDKLSNGNTDVEINIETKDEIGDLAKSLNHTVSYMKDRVNITDKIANGDLNVDINVRSEEDILSKSLLRLSSNIKMVMSEIQHMSTEHNLGDIDVVIDEGKFEGVYKDVASGINEMIGEHIRATQEILRCVDDFTKGNFETQIEDFPGKKASVNHAVEAMRKGLKDVNSEINTLITAAGEGRLSERANASAYSGDWGTLMGGLNNLIDAIIEPINEAAQVLEEMSRGNLNIKVRGDYKGDHAKIKDTMNYTIKTLHEYVEEISYTLEQMSNHDLTVAIETEYVGDFANIKSSLNLIIDSLNEVMGEINFASEQVSGGAKQVSDSSQALSQGSSEQASSVEEITASIEQVAAQTKQNALNANNANELATKARDEATEGNKHMNEMVKSMEDINESSGNISRIIKVIDDIAFQTNILALNAAVEAARAGQHGKGFAVVAEEVRNLAARSADAARETTDMIEDSIKTTEAGTGIAYQTAKSLEEILEGVSDVSNLVSEIASASNEQATAVSQVNQAIDQVSTVTQMNTSTSEESAAASEELSGQAEMLKEMVGKFRLKGQYKAKPNRASKSYDYKEKEYDNRDKNDEYEDIEISLDDIEFGKYS